MNSKEAIKWLYSLGEHKIRLGLKSINQLLSKIDNPEKELRCIHITGTNGKGSVCAMISQILIEAGYKVGMYTSPHLIEFNERITVNNKQISNSDLGRLADIIKNNYTNQTFFEVTTALAFLYFKEQKIDFLVLEVGLGGRLDATNVVNPLVSVITNIDIEHTDYLGDTIKSIAYEKAGIIKENKPTITGAKGTALAVIKKVCKEKNSELFLVKKYKKTNGGFDIDGYKNLKNSLRGDFQLMNATIALTTIDILKKFYKIKIDNKSIKNGFKNTKWPGRFEFIEKNVLVDCAHNPAGIKVLKKELIKIIKNYKNKILVIGILRDKDYKKMLKLIVPLFNKIILTKPDYYRTLKPKVLEKEIKQYNKDYVIKKNVKEAYNYAKSISGKKDLIVVTGSIYVVGELYR